MLRSLRGFLMISLFFRTYPANWEQILKISLSRILSWCNLAISKLKISNYLSGPFRVWDSGTRLYLNFSIYVIMSPFSTLPRCFVCISFQIVQECIFFQTKIVMRVVPFEFALHLHRGSLWHLQQNLKIA